MLIEKMFTYPFSVVWILALAAVVWLAVKYLWPRLKKYQIQLLRAHWSPWKVGLLVFFIWMLVEIFVSFVVFDIGDWVSKEVVLECDGELTPSVWGICNFAERALTVFFWLVLAFPQAALAGVIMALLLKADGGVRRTLAKANADLPVPDDQGDIPTVASDEKAAQKSNWRILSGLRKAGASCGNAAKTAGRSIMKIGNVKHIFRRRGKPENEQSREEI